MEYGQFMQECMGQRISVHNDINLSRFPIIYTFINYAMIDYLYLLKFCTDCCFAITDYQCTFLFWNSVPSNA